MCHEVLRGEREARDIRHAPTRPATPTRRRRMTAWATRINKIGSCERTPRAFIRHVLEPPADGLYYVQWCMLRL